MTKDELFERLAHLADEIVHVSNEGDADHYLTQDDIVDSVVEVVAAYLDGVENHD